MTRARRCGRGMRTMAARGLRLTLAATVALALGGCVPIGVRVQNMLAAVLG
jgi:hypothetical protein